jgi:N utilization substance protein B
VYENIELIDGEIAPCVARPIREIDPVELAVLRIGTYEILKRPDVPYRVVINESLELTKKFGSIEGYKFVNGVLDKIARKHRSTEIKMGR